MTLSTDKRLRLRLQTKTSILQGNIHTTSATTLPTKELVPVDPGLPVTIFKSLNDRQSEFRQFRESSVPIMYMIILQFRELKQRRRRRQGRRLAKNEFIFYKRNS